MALVSGDGPNAQKAVPNGKGGMKVISGPNRFAAPAPGSGSRDSGGAGGSGSRSAEPANRFEQVNPRRLQPYSYEVPAPVSKDPVERVRQQLPAVDAIADFLTGKLVVEGQPGVSAAEAKASAKKSAEPDTVTERHRGRKTYQMTWEDYNKLSDRQRAAVDFNTLLVDAREKDLAKQDEYAELDDLTKKTYEKSVRRMFGEDGGSDTYAPETMAVLRQLDYDGKAQDQDLDNFLSLKVAIGEKDLARNFDTSFTQAKVGALMDATDILGGFDPNDMQYVKNTLVEKTRELTEALTRGGQMLASLRRSTALDPERQTDLQVMAGVDPRDPMLGLGFRDEKRDEQGVPLDLNTYAKDFLFKLADKSINPEDLFASARNDAQLSDEEFGKLAQFIDVQTRNSMNYDVAFGKGGRSAVEIRQAAGLGKGG